MIIDFSQTCYNINMNNNVIKRNTKVYVYFFADCIHSNAYWPYF